MKLDQDKKIYFLFLVISFFFLVSVVGLKNILVSGCLLYPLKITCFSNFNWTNIEKTIQVSSENEAWAKGWPDFRNTNDNNITQSEYSENFLWLKTWVNNHFLIILKILIPYIIFLTFLLIVHSYPTSLTMICV